MIYLQIPRAAFEFVIQGSPAEFAVMARESILKEMGLICTVRNPGTQRKILEFPLDINPIAVRFLDRDTSLDLVAHKLLNGNTLLKVSLFDNGKGWWLWDAFRDEMERLGWFSIPTKESMSLPVDFKPPEIKGSEITSSNTDSEPLPTIEEPKKEPSQTWLMIPDKGWDRECIRLWHRGLTCKDIGIRLQKTDKTILNRLNQLRKEFGEQIVPYRNANYRLPHIHIHHQRIDPEVWGVGYGEGLPLYFRDHDGPAMPEGGYEVLDNEAVPLGPVVTNY